MQSLSRFMLAALCATLPVLASGQTAYRVLRLPGLGGSAAAGASIDDLGLVSGSANLTGDQAVHAALWLNGMAHDLGTLGGPNSVVQWPSKNSMGLLAGIAQTAQPDPLGESWSCAAFFPGPQASGHTCLGFVWVWGRMLPLPTLGGNNSFAAGVNDRGEVTGWAENRVRDPSCDTAGSGQVLQFRPVVWGPAPGQLRELPLLPGDSAGAATASNDEGQVVGISGSCDQAVGRYSARHAVLWEHGMVRDLGNLGGVAWHTPMAINRYGHVVGFSNVSAADGGQLHEHAFLWTPENGMRDLGTLYPGDVHSQALGINARDQVVGVSCTAHFASCHAFVWENGRMSDLAQRVTGGDDLAVVQALDINDAGAISGQGYDPVTETTVAFLAVPAGVVPASAVRGSMPERPLPQAMRTAWLRRWRLERAPDSP